MSPSDLHVVAAISNPVRYASRYRLYKDFAAYVRASGAILWTIEEAFGERPFEITDAAKPREIQVRSSGELWRKENLQNIAVQHLTRQEPAWKYVAFVDADVLFARPDWALETVHQLQHYDVVQMFSHCQDLGPNFEPVVDENDALYLPAMVLQQSNGRAWGRSPYGRHPGHCGYAWAWRRAALEAVGGLIDFSICGANDHHMTRGLFGDIDGSINGRSSAGLKARLHQWQELAVRAIGRNVGLVPGMVLHHWHGHKRARGYHSRWQILVDSQFDPATDLRRDAAGLYQLTGNKPKLRDDLRAYFRARDEDAR